MANMVIGPVPYHYESGVEGAGPAIWFGKTAPDGANRDWLEAPIGALYCHKPSTTAATWYIKAAANGAVADWVSWAGAGQNGALIYGAGTTGTPITTSAANKNFMDLRTQSTATTGGSDTRAAYFRLALAGATTGGGDALRAYNVVSAHIGTAHGAHLSLKLDTGGAVSGQGEAVRGTLELPAGNNGGTLAAVQGEIWLSAATSAITGAHGIFRASVGGDATLNETVKNLLMIDGVESAAVGADTGQMVTTGCAAAVASIRIRCLLNGSPIWLFADATTPNVS